MPRCSPPSPSPALKAFLDEAVVPILVERFLREHRIECAGTEDVEQDGGASTTTEMRAYRETATLRDAAEPARVSPVAGS